MKFRRVIIFSVITILAIIAIPSWFYYSKFKNMHLSDNPADWGTFGDYIGGVIGTCFGLLATVLALISIYVSLKISETVQENEIKFNTDNSEREIKRFEKEIELIQKQNMPYPYLEFFKGDDNTKIHIQNQGLGPLYIENWNINYMSTNFRHFFHLYSEKMDIDLPTSASFYSNTAPLLILAPNTSKMLFELIPLNTPDTKYKVYQDNSREILKDCIITIEYLDIFENKFTLTKNLSFFA